MTGSAQSAQDTSQAAGGTGTTASAGDQSKQTDDTVLGGDGKQQQQAQADGQAKQTDGDGKKPDGQQQGDDKSKQQQQAKAPEKYEDFKVPDGVTLDTKAVEAFSPLFRELNLTQDQAQKLVDVQAKVLSDAATAYQAQLKDDAFALEQVGAVLGNQRESWGKALKADGEIGGKDYDKNVQTAQRAIARFGSPELKNILKTTGLGNHPEFVRFCLKVGHTVTEDSTALGGGAAAGSRKSNEDVFYGGEQKAS
jgi:hypothetical protein